MADYVERLAALRPGDQVIFSDGLILPVVALLDTQGKGLSTFFFETMDGYLVRLPKRFGTKIMVKTERITYEAIHASFLSTAPGLLEAGVDIVDIDFDRSIPGERILVKKLPIVLTLDELRLHWRTMDPKAVAHYLELTFQWFEKTWKLRSIGDFSLDNLAFTADRAVLLDWAWGAVQAHRLSDGSLVHYDFAHFLRKMGEMSDRDVNFFDALPDLASVGPSGHKLQSRVLESITRQRRAAGWTKAPGICERVVKAVAAAAAIAAPVFGFR